MPTEPPPQTDASGDVPEPAPARPLSDAELRDALAEGAPRAVPLPGNPADEPPDDVRSDPDRLTDVVTRWAQLGVGRVVRSAGATGPGAAVTPPPITNARALANLLVDTSDVARDDPRLAWTVAAWLATHPALVDVDALARALEPLDAAFDVAARCPADAEAASGNSQIRRRRVLGVLATIAGALAPAVVAPGGPLHAAATPRPAWAEVLRRVRATAFFTLVDANPVLRHYAEADARADVAVWGFWLDDVTDSRDAIRPLRWVLDHNPELGEALRSAAAR